MNLLSCEVILVTAPHEGHRDGGHRDSVDPIRAGAVGLGTGHPLRLLLVEDDAGDAYLVQDLLAGSPLRVEITWVRSMAAARAAQGGDWQVVLLDLGLPDSEGLDGLAALLELTPQAAVLVLTGLSDEHRGLEAVARGAQDYLVKGETDDALLVRAIRYAVERKRADDSLRRLYETELRQEENARLERGLLPSPILRSGDVGCVTRYRPGRHRALLGGDFFDVVETDDGVLHVVIGDVMGHGPDEAALGVCLRIAWRTLVLAGVPDTAKMPILDEIIVRERGPADTFATVCSLAVSRDRSSAEVTLAGHPAPLLVASPARPLLVDPTGPAIGVLPGMTWEARTVPLEAGWSLLLYTDGLVEGRVAGGPGRLGEEGLLRLVDGLITQAVSPLRLADHLIDAAEKHNQGSLVDDVAVLVLSCPVDRPRGGR